MILPLIEGPRNRVEAGRSDLHTVTVVAPTAMAAEVAAKVALILGHEEGGAYLEARGPAGLLVDHAERVHALRSFSMA